MPFRPFVVPTAVLFDVSTDGELLFAWQLSITIGSPSEGDDVVAVAISIVCDGERDRERE